MWPAMIFGQCRCALGIGWRFPCMRWSLANSGDPRDCCRGSQMRGAETAYHLADLGTQSAGACGCRTVRIDLGALRVTVLHKRCPVGRSGYRWSGHPAETPDVAGGSPHRRCTAARRSAHCRRCLRFFHRPERSMTICGTAATNCQVKRPLPKERRHARRRAQVRRSITS